jgi:spermidine synthase
MGAMALGAWLAARACIRLRDLLFAYAMVETVIGLFGLSFHPLYVGATDAALTGVFPRLASPFWVDVVKSSLAAALILPQSILLGMTFPLMTVGAMRRCVIAPGNAVATLYFVNSLGAAVGVLVSGFVLIRWVGLPGTVHVAGFLNLVIAAAVLMVSRRLPGGAVSAPPPAVPLFRDFAASPLLIVSALTGAASFVYEIAWIRMLNMVLGSSTHSFELMLSAFILGLALGGLWIRRTIDRIGNTLVVLGFVQIAMGVLAMTTVAFYDFTFDLMSAVLFTVARTKFGYFGFMLLGHAIAMLIMLPTTICAGMTLPLITKTLLASGGGEKSVGQVYAANTVGAIAGVIVTVHLLMPLTGLKTALLVGAAVDLAIGVALLMRFARGADRQALPAVIGGAFAFALITATWVDLDPRKMASAVYRNARPLIADDGVIDSHRDGKTASVSVFTTGGSHRVLSTNGKPEASMELNPTKPAGDDESTQILTGVLPLMVKPDARRVAVIGIGSGMSTHALLQSPALESVDTIEIEAEMVAGARFFMPHVAAVFEDPRSRIHIDDARTFFSTHQRKYDLIISEPSNPWVSGVSSLFSAEFYRLAKRYLAPGGILAQWLQLYEIDLRLVASVFSALASEFDRILVFEMADGNLLMMATVDGEFADDAEAVFDMPGMATLLARVEIHTPADLRSRRLAPRRVLMPLFDSYTSMPNSDYFPVVDLSAPYARFLMLDATALSTLARAPVPVLEMLGAMPLRSSGVTVGPTTTYETLNTLARGEAIAGWYDGPDHARQAAAEGLDDDMKLRLNYLNEPRDCDHEHGRELWISSLVAVGGAALPYLEPAAGKRLLDRLYRADCAAGEDARAGFDLLTAVVRRDPAVMAELAEGLLSRDGPLADEHLRFLAGAAMLGRVVRGESRAVSALWERLNEDQRERLERFLEFRLLRAHAGWRGPD